MQSYALKLLALTGLGIVLLAGLAAAEVTYPAGSRIGLEPPQGITLNKTTNTFEDAANKTTISVLDLPLQLYSEMEHMVFAQTNQPGVNIIKRESFPYASGIGYFVAVELTVEGTKFRKWLLLGQSNVNPVPNLATLVSFQAPESALTIYTDEIVRKTLASVTFRPTPNDERLGLMPFKITDLAGFEVTEVAPGGVILTDKPERGGQPEMIVSTGQTGSMSNDDRSLFARQLIERSPVIGMEIMSAEPMRIAGMPGHEIKARGRSPNGDQIMLVQWLRFTGGSYIRIIGGAGAGEWDNALPRFRALRDGITLR